MKNWLGAKYHERSLRFQQRNARRILSAQCRLPATGVLDESVQSCLTTQANAKGVELSDLVNDLLRGEIEIEVGLSANADQTLTIFSKTKMTLTPRQMDYVHFNPVGHGYVKRAFLMQSL
ncbi:MAG: hypothetical protein LBQ62_08480 [Candidatus Accumulibacter sp.]|nr:hypothetical protein [Accumulibacter sp.]